MLFTSKIFALLAIITFLFYYLPQLRKIQIEILVAASLLFYAYNQPALVLLLLLSASINIVSSYYIVYGNDRYKKTAAVAGVVLNLSILVFFKYSPLLSRTFFSPTNSIGEFLLTIPLPIGISFFTFQGISLVVDVYKGKYFKRKDVVPAQFFVHAKRVLFFKAFFPQLISGPIVKAHDFIPQIAPKFFKDIDWQYCFKKLVLGYFLKMVIADNLKDFTYWISYPYFMGKSSTTLLTALFGYSFQIFADFAGYSLIAIGLAGLFGYKFPENFNFPYISSSFSEFWKRWHISLSSFLKEYLYIPMGGNRKGKARTYFNLLMTMVLGGIWHGAAWNYAVWGILHGSFLAIERFKKDLVTLPEISILKPVKIFFIFTMVSFAWILFKLTSFQHSMSFICEIRDNFAIKNDVRIISYIILYSLPIVLYHAAHIASTRLPEFERTIKDSHIAYACMLVLLILNSGSSGSFIYFQF